MIDNRYLAKLPEDPGIITLSGQQCSLINGWMQQREESAVQTP
jgi:hypothetical protein